MATETVNPPVQEPPSKLRKVYDYLVSQNKVRPGRSFEEFEQRMQDPARLEKVYNYLKENNKVRAENFEQFQDKLGLKKKDQPFQGGAPMAPTPDSIPIQPTQPLDQPKVSGEVSSPVLESGLTEEQERERNLAELAKYPVASEQQPPKSKSMPFVTGPDTYAAIAQADIQQRMQQPPRKLTPEEIEFQKNRERNPLVSFGKTVWNLAANTIPSAGASMLGIMAEGSNLAQMPETVPPGTKAPTIDEMRETSKLAKARLLEYAHEQNLEGAEYMKNIVNSMDKISDPVDALNYVFSAVGQAVGQIPLSVATGGGSSIMQEVGSIYYESVRRIAEEKGMSIRDVIRQGLDEPAYALAYGTAAGMMDRFGAGKVMGAFKSPALKQAMRSRAMSVGTSTGVEGATEYAQTWLEQIGARHGSGSSFTEAITEVVTDPTLRQEQLEGFVQGLIGGSALAGSGAGISTIRNRKQPAVQPTQPTQQNETVPSPTESVAPEPDADTQTEPVSTTGPGPDINDLKRSEVQAAPVQSEQPTDDQTQVIPPGTTMVTPTKVTEQQSPEAEEEGETINDQTNEQNQERQGRQEELLTTQQSIRDKISTFFDQAIKIKDKVIKEVLRPVSNVEAETLSSETGIEITPEYQHVVTNAGINHVLKKHGNVEAEAKQGQIAITKADFENIPEIINSPDKIEYAGKNKQGFDGIRYTKKFDDGTTYYLEEIRTGRKELALNTMYKKKEGSSGELVEKSPSPTAVPPPDISSPTNIRDSEETVVTDSDHDSATVQTDDQPEATETNEIAENQPFPIGSEVEFEWLGREMVGKVDRYQHKRAHIKTKDGISYRMDPSKLKAVDPKKNLPRDASEIVKHNSRRKKPLGLIGDPSNGFIFMTDLGEKVVDAFKKYFRSRGFIPTDVFKRWLQTKGEISKWENQIKFTTTDLKKAIKDDYGNKKLTDAQITDLNLYLQGKQNVNPIPPNTMAVLDRMRAQIDHLSQRFIDEGISSGDLSATIAKNMGVYLNRSYRKYDDPFWAELVDPQVRNKAEGVIRNNAHQKGAVWSDRAKAIAKRMAERPAKLIKMNDRLAKLKAIMAGTMTNKKIDSLRKMRDDLINQVEARVSEIKRKLQGNLDEVTELEAELVDLIENGAYYEFLDKSEVYLDDVTGEIYDNPDAPTQAENIQERKERLTKLRGSILKKADFIWRMEDKVDKIRKSFSNKEQDVIADVTKQSQNLDKAIQALSTRDYQSMYDKAAKEADRLLNISQDEIEGIINYILYEPDAPMAILKGSKLGSKDLSILKKRGDIAPEIRALMGEYADPLVNYARTITKMASLISKHHFLMDVKQFGLGKFLFENQTGKYHVPIAAKGSKTMEPLNGLYTTREIAEAFQEFESQDHLGPFMRFYMKLVSWVKLNKTVFSVQTHARNVVGNLFFVIDNGHWRANEAGKAVQVAWSQLYNSDQAIRDKYLEYAELGIVQDSTSGGELRHLISDVREGKDFFESLGERSLSKASRKFAEKTMAAYQAEDDMFKIYAFENEFARYRKAYPNKPVDEVKRMAAEIVRNTYPTYSMVPKAVKALRNFPILGTFVSFPAEVLRTKYNTIEIALKEMRTPETWKIGAIRLGSTMSGFALTTGMSMASRMFNGLDWEDEEDLRKFVAPWQRDSEFIFLNVDGAKYTVIDMGYTDPHVYLKKPIYQFLDGEPVVENVIDAAIALAEPFLNEDLLFERIIDLNRNKTSTGLHVYNPDAPLGDKAAAIYNHLYTVTEPGTIVSARRIFKGLHGDVDRRGNPYDPKLEAISVVTGQKQEVKDITQSLLYRAYELKDRIELTKGDYDRIAKSKASTPEQIAEAKRIHDASMKRIVEDAKGIYAAAIRLGVDPKEAGNAMARTKSPEIYLATAGSAPKKK